MCNASSFDVFGALQVESALQLTERCVQEQTATLEVPLVDSKQKPVASSGQMFFPKTHHLPTCLSSLELIGTAARAGMLEDLIGASGNLVHEDSSCWDFKGDAAKLILIILASLKDLRW